MSKSSCRRIIFSVLNAILVSALFSLPLANFSAQAKDDKVEDYLKRLPYQETHNYLMQYTGGDPAKLNKWVGPVEPVLIKAGEDKVVRSNNDTFYKQAFADLSEGPVILIAKHVDPDRFSSFQLMDDHNVNFRNVIRPEGRYVLYHGEPPKSVEGELIEVPSKIMAVIVRVEVKNPQDKDDIAKAKAIHKGIGITGPKITSIETLDLLSEFDEKTVKKADSQIEEVKRTVPFREMVAGPGDVPSKVSYLKLATGTKHGWGGPVLSHSSYEAFFTDAKGKPLVGADGPYTVTTEQPPVDAFWSVTVYDTSTGRFFANPEDRYHINNTIAVKNKDGSVTFLFKTDCADTDENCLYVPEGEFDITARYYLPDERIQTGEWTMPRPEKLKQK